MLFCVFRGRAISVDRRNLGVATVGHVRTATVGDSFGLYPTAWCMCVRIVIQCCVIGPTLRASPMLCLP